MLNRDQMLMKSHACPRNEDSVAYVQGELSAGEMRAFEQHCRECTSCRAEVDACRRILARLSEVRSPAETRDLAPAILARIAAEEWSAPRLTLQFQLLLPQLARIAALLLILAGAGSLVFFMSRTDRQPVPVVAMSGSGQATVEKAPGVEPTTKAAAVDCGLTWLETNQEPDGSWDAEKWGADKSHRVGVTALSLLALMAGGEEHAGAIERGMEYLLRQQDTNGLYGPVCANSMYNHGIATVAMLKAALSGRKQAEKDSCARAVDFICASQRKSGGWSYSREGAEPANTSITVWQLQSLLLAESMGIPDLAPRIERSMTWLRGMVDGSGRMGYTRADEFPNGPDTLTAAGILCLTGKGIHTGDRTAQMIKALETAAAAQGESVDYYRWYFLTHALQAAGGEGEKLIVGRLQDTLVARQTRTGPAAGSWEPGDQWASAGGKIYSTSMALLSLQ